MLEFNSKEVAVENSKNVYTDGELCLELPEGTRLVSMPHMSWPKVTISNYYVWGVRGIFWKNPLRYL
jgi:hypothetical protein